MFTSMSFCFQPGRTEDRFGNENKCACVESKPLTKLSMGFLRSVGVLKVAHCASATSSASIVVAPAAAASTRHSICWGHTASNSCAVFPTTVALVVHVKLHPELPRDDGLGCVSELKEQRLFFDLCVDSNGIDGRPTGSIRDE